MSLEARSQSGSEYPIPRDTSVETVASKNAISPFLTPADTKISVLLSASVKRLGVSRMRDLFNHLIDWEILAYREFGSIDSI